MKPEAQVSLIYMFSFDGDESGRRLLFLESAIQSSHDWLASHYFINSRRHIL